MADYKALTFINLPLLDIKKAPGDMISDEEFTAGGQTEDDITALIDGGALSTDPNAPLHPDNQPVPVPVSINPEAIDVVADDQGKGVTNEPDN
jgi:hypothetical protein